MTANDEKAFDCLMMKGLAQAKLLDEFEKRQNEFVSYGEFLVAKMNESPKMKRFWEEISKKNAKIPA